MKLILSNAIINLDRIVSIYVEDGTLRLERNDAAYIVKNIPDNALQQVAVATAEGKPYIELDGILNMEENNDNQ